MVRWPASLSFLALLDERRASLLAVVVTSLAALFSENADYAHVQYRDAQHTDESSPMCSLPHAAQDFPV